MLKGVRYDAPVSPETLAAWNRQLETLFPKTDELSHLLIRWEPGNAWVVDGVWQAVERWFIWELFPLWTQDELIQRECKSTIAPRELNHYDGTKHRVMMVTTITQPQYEMYQETGMFAKPLWVIQGEKGGHPMWYGQAEKRMRKLAGLPTEAPYPGDLPYAPFDSRVIKHMEHFARLRQLQAEVRNTRRSRSDAMKAQMTAKEREWRVAFIKWMEEQITPETGKTLNRVIDKLGLDAKRADTDYSREWEEGKNRFIETGYLR